MILGTRGSRLAMAQSDMVLKLMRERYPEEMMELKIVSTVGDRVRDQPLASLGGFGAFVKELDNKILSGEIDIAVNSLKDMPVVPTEGTEIAAILPRGNVEDVLVSTVPLERMPPGSVIGTSSVRRRCLLLNLRPDLVVKDLRGNVPTRVGKMRDGTFDGIVLARAGIERLNLDCKMYVLDPEQFIPAVGQGAIAIVCKEGSPYSRMLAAFDDADTRTCVEAERYVMRSLGGGCSIPIGIWATKSDISLRLRAIVMDSDGMTSFRLDRSIDIGSLDEGLDSVSKELLYAWELVK
ncbi:MAG TPA: hydroxymethylbilane synthase [Methanomassiliicoccales archaeon]|jgi:hydroxymethylbilane synthase